jgi:hypothetical protein
MMDKWMDGGKPGLKDCIALSKNCSGRREVFKLLIIVCTAATLILIVRY